MLYELIYESYSQSVPTYEELDSLLKQARLKNERLGVTGMLVYHNREFIQLLEGERDVLMELYGAIQRDERHSRLRIIWESEIPERGFADWRMGFLDTRTDACSLEEGFSNFLEDGILTGARRSPTVAKRLFTHLRRLILNVPG